MEEEFLTVCRSGTQSGSLPARQTATSVNKQFWDVLKTIDMLSRPQLFRDIQATAAWVLMALSSLYNTARMYVAPPQVSHAYDAGSNRVARGIGPARAGTKYLTCTLKSDTFLAHALSLATRGYADDLVRTYIAHSYIELNDISQLTTSSPATALGPRALQLHPEDGLRFCGFKAGLSTFLTKNVQNKTMQKYVLFNSHSQDNMLAAFYR